VKVPRHDADPRGGRDGVGSVCPTLPFCGATTSEEAEAGVLSDLTFGGAPRYLVTPPERLLPARVVALRDFLLERIPRALA
jgi:hypothetical protein